MGEQLPFSVKQEIISKMDSHEEELIIPDLVPSEDVSRRVASLIKVEPAITSTLVDGEQDIENPYQCFECGLDCESQRELIDHYESAHTEETSRKSEVNGNACPETDVDDPLAGDVAPDSPEKAANVEGAQNDDPPYEVLLLYSCPCCGHSSSDWNHLIKHLEKHVQVTSLTCLNCMYIFSNSYHLENYRGRDSSDKPHICCHCPFRTQSYQALKDHCVTHHNTLAPIKLSSNVPNCTPSNDINPVKNNTNHTNFVDTASETISLQQQNPVPPLKIPLEASQAGSYVVLRNSSSDWQNSGNIAVPLQSLFPGIEGPLFNPPGVILQALVANPPNHISPSTAQKGVQEKNGSLNTHGNQPVPEIIPNLIPKLNNPPESGQSDSPGLPSPKAKSSNRAVHPKVPVDELVKKWSFTSIAPKPPNIAPKVSEACPKPLLLTGMPPYQVPKGSRTSRKGVRNKSCPYCSHLFRDTHSLNTHILIHTKEKPFACEFCNYRATQRVHIKKHMKTHLKWERRKI